MNKWEKESEESDKISLEGQSSVVINEKIKESDSE